LDSSQISYLFEIALTAILKANAEILKIYDQNQFIIDFKSDHSPVTQADKISSKIICKQLKKTGIPIICEEIRQENFEIRKSWEYFWLVDPLDGTKEFINRNGEFTVNIALIHQNAPILGLISIPVKGLLYWGDSQNGAFKIKISKIIKLNHKLLMRKAIKLPRTKRPVTFNILVSRSHPDDQTLQYIKSLIPENKKIKKIKAGSSLKFCIIAEGIADLYLRFSPTMEWDTAAGQAIVNASGGKLKSLPAYDDFLYNKKNLKNGAFIVFRDLSFIKMTV
jgi:3'(2'), 5'-bisphosphate nucleotidase